MLRLAVRARALGYSFDDFWRLAMRPRKPPITPKVPREKWPPDAVVWPRDSRDREVWISATNAARDGWRRAYEGIAPTRAEAALILLGPEMKVDPAILPALPFRPDEPLPTTREDLVALLDGLGAGAALRSAA